MRVPENFVQCFSTFERFPNIPLGAIEKRLNLLPLTSFNGSSSLCSPVLMALNHCVAGCCEMLPVVQLRFRLAQLRLSSRLSPGASLLCRDHRDRREP